MVVLVALGFMLSAFVRESECFQLIWFIFFKKMWAYLCVCVPKFVCI